MTLTSLEPISSCKVPVSTFNETPNPFEAIVLESVFCSSQDADSFIDCAAPNHGGSLGARPRHDLSALDIISDLSSCFRGRPRPMAPFSLARKYT